MALKTFRPLTPATASRRCRRSTKSPRRKPEKSAARDQEAQTGGRNNYGRITTRHIGGGHKQKYRIVDFKRTQA